MIVTRTEQETGGPDRTRREEIIPLFTGSPEVEPDQDVDFSQSQGWPWASDPSVCTMKVQLAAVKAFGEPFAELDSQAKNESEGGGIATFPYNHLHLPLSDQYDDEGKLIVDVNPGNFDARIAYFMALYPGFFSDRIPIAGGTKGLAAFLASDDHFMGEFGNRPRGKRPVRARVLWGDGIFQDLPEIESYLEDAAGGGEDGLGVRKGWDEKWLLAVLGEGEQPDGSNPGLDTYREFEKLANKHSWIHAYSFLGVRNHKEIAEDMAVAAVPVNA